MGDDVEAVKAALRFLIWKLHAYRPPKYGHIATVVVRGHAVHVMYATRCPAERIEWIGPMFAALINTFSRAYVEGMPEFRIYEYCEAEQARRAVGRVIVLPDHVCDNLQAPVPFKEYVNRHGEPRTE